MAIEEGFEHKREQEGKNSAKGKLKLLEVESIVETICKFENHASHDFSIVQGMRRDDLVGRI
jgi:hypothetical protein